MARRPTPEARHQDERVVGALRVLREDLIRQRLRPGPGVDVPIEAGRDAVGREDQQTGPGDCDARRLQGRQPHADDADTLQEALGAGAARRSRLEEEPLDVPDSDPGDRPLPGVPARQAQDHAAAAEQFLVAALHDLDQAQIGVALHRAHRQVRRLGRLAAVPESVDHPQKRAVRQAHHQVPIPRLGLPRERPGGRSPFHRSSAQRFHFLAVTVVPLPIRETISNSSISRLTPGSPSPRLPEVE